MRRRRSVSSTSEALKRNGRMSVPSLPVGCATSLRAFVMAFTLLETPKSPSGPAASVAAATPQKRRRSKSRVIDIPCLPRIGHLAIVMSGLPSFVASCPVAIADVLHAVDGSRGDEQGVAGLDRRPWLALDPVLERPFADIDDLFARMRVP